MFIGHFAWATRRGWAPACRLPRCSPRRCSLTCSGLFVALGIGSPHRPGHHGFDTAQCISYQPALALDARRSSARRSAGLSLSSRGATRAPPHLARTRRTYRTRCVAFLLVMSHWVLDVVTHIPDLPLYPAARSSGRAMEFVTATLCRNGDVAVGVWIYASDDAARQDWDVGVCRRDGISVRRVSRQRQGDAAAVGHRVVGDGDRARRVHALAVLVCRSSPQIVGGGDMATNAAPAAAPRVGIWEDFVDIFYAPSAVFRRRENGNVFIPLAVVTIACGVLFYLNSGALQPMSMPVRPEWRSRCGRTRNQRGGGAYQASPCVCSRWEPSSSFHSPIAGVGVATWLPASSSTPGRRFARR